MAIETKRTDGCSDKGNTKHIPARTLQTGIHYVVCIHSVGLVHLNGLNPECYLESS